MASWVVTCPSCRQEFVHSEIAESDSVFDSFGGPRKPDVGPEGAEMTCPSCRTSSVFKRHQLRYRRENRLKPSPDLGTY